jgi:hypothetical protein
LRRTELALALALAGCMKIYPDPELPDVEVQWFTFDCGEGPSTITISLIGVDTPAARVDHSEPCAIEAKTTFADLARERYTLAGSLLDANNQPVGRGVDFEVIDLRNGLDTRTSLFFDMFIDLGLGWTFADETTTCESLAADTVRVQLSPQGKPAFTVDRPCELGGYTGGVDGGIYTASVRALSAGAVVATSPESAPVTVDERMLADAGILTLTPCAPSCPAP